MIRIHKPEHFALMRKAGGLAALTLDYLEDFVRPGITTNQINQLAHDFIIKNQAIPAPLGYKGYPKSVCTSLNEVVCHGIPDATVLKEGDILNIDVTVIVDGWHGDTSRMFKVGEISLAKENLIQAAYDAMMVGINAIKPGTNLENIGEAIETLAKSRGYSVVREFCGHGIGRKFHDKPDILNYRGHDRGIIIKPGMFFTVEPMVNAGKGDIFILKDGWTVVTQDGSLSAQFEHTIGVTDNGYEIFTKV